MPCPLCSSPVPDEAVTLTNDFPAWFSSSSCGNTEANDGLPMPRYMSR